jgi:hypothetical protein
MANTLRTEKRKLKRIRIVACPKCRAEIELTGELNPCDWCECVLQHDGAIVRCAERLGRQRHEKNEEAQAIELLQLVQLGQ